MILNAFTALENQTVKLEVPQEQKPVNVWNPPEVADPGSSGIVTVLQQQQQQHINEIQKLQQQLQEQQRINQQQQEVLRQKQIPAGQGAVSIPQLSSVGGQPTTLPQQGPQFQPSHQGQPQLSQASPKFQLQPHVLAQIQALTGEYFTFEVFSFHGHVSMTYNRVIAKKRACQFVQYS